MEREIFPEFDPRTLEEARVIIAMLSERYARLLEQARHDALIPTMLNKIETERHVENRVATGKPFGLFLIDLNHFKAVNDEADHMEGDRQLLRLGALLHEAFKRDSDKVAQGRIGGDEFVIVVDMTGDNRREDDPLLQMDNVYAYLKRIETQYREEDAVATHFELGFAIGSALFDPARPIDAGTLFRQADEAMYEEKGADAR